MTKRRARFAIIALVWAVCCSAQLLPKEDVSLAEVTDDRFHAGDIWEYKTRPSEQGSRLTILRVEKSPELGIIVHVAVNNLRLANCTGGPEPERISHMPFARKALDESVTRRVSEAYKVPAFQEGYDKWRAAYSQKRAGIYVVSVADAVKVAEYTFQRGLGCASDKAP